MSSEDQIFSEDRLTQKLPLETFKTSSEEEANRYLFGRYRREDNAFCDYIQKVLEHPLFKSMMISTIALNAIFLALETDYKIRYQSHPFLEVAEVITVAIYTTEFLLNVYVEPITYWQSGYKRYDATVLFIAYLPYFIDGSTPQTYHTWIMIKGFQALRVLKLVYYSTGMTILMTALGQTAKNVCSVLILLFLLMFIFAVLGHGLYGDPVTGDSKNWGSLAAAFFTLFSLVTVDGWTDLQEELDEVDSNTSRTFTIVFILLGFFVFFNMFIGVVIMDIQVCPTFLIERTVLVQAAEFPRANLHAITTTRKDTTEKYEQELKAKRQAVLHEKKQNILKRQQEEVSALINKQKSNEYEAFNKLVEDFKKTLHHSDPVILEDFCASLPFIDLYLTSLDRQDTTVYRLQELYIELIATLTTMLQESQEKSLQSLQSLKQIYTPPSTTDTEND